MRNYRSALSSIIVAGLCSGGVLMAQGTQSANIAGSVVSRTGEPISGVLVRLSSPSMQGIRTTVTDQKGRFAAHLLPAGTYTITLSKEGLVTLKTESSVGIGQSFEPRFVMAAVGAAVVEVVATASDIDKTDVKTATNYRLDNVDKLPSGRTLENVALLTPGVTTGVGGRVQIRGGMTSGNMYLLDGQNITDNLYNNRGMRLIDDAIEEVQVITGAASAEYGSMDGGVINAVTKSGGNEFHGQLRWELQNPKWNAVKRNQDRDSIRDVNLQEKTLSFSGFILKDKLWFSGSIFKTDQNQALSIDAPIPVATYVGDWGSYTTGNGNSTVGDGASYNFARSEIRRQIKLTWAITQDHSLIGSFSNAKINDTNRDYSAGEMAALVPQTSTSEFANLQWRAVWSNFITSELKLGRKKQMLSAGSTLAGVSPIYNYSNATFYQNGIFNSADGGDNRNNQTASLKVTMFWDTLGSHQTDVGGDYYKGIQRARNEQTVTGYIFGVRRMNLEDHLAYGRDIWVYTSGEGEADNFTHAFYVNDRWTLNTKWSFNLGLRYDSFKAQDEAGSSTAAASGFSPRLGAKYDVAADGKYVIGASFARYNSKVLETITNSVTKQGNPTEIDHPYIGDAGPQTWAYLSNLSTIHSLYNFDVISYYNDPTVNVRLNKDLKAPTVDEFQTSFMYSFDSPIGNGFVRATGVYKNWNNLIDYRVGNDGTVATDNGDVYVKVWGNNAFAKRRYKALELDTQLTKGKWNFQGNITFSELKGNYEGESTNSPGRGEGLGSFTVQDGVQMYSNSTTAPYGYLKGDVPIRARFNSSYVVTTLAGDTTFGIVYAYDRGNRWSRTRTIDPLALNSELSGQYGTSATQYLGERGSGGSYPSVQKWDFSVTQDLPVFKVRGITMHAFLKVRIDNVFNHVQQLSYNTQYADGALVADGGSLSEAWAVADPAKFGKAVTSDDFLDMRYIRLSAGVRF